MNRVKLILTACAAASGLWAGGCARTGGPLLELTPASARWPAPPDTARIAFLGEIRCDADLKPSRNPLQALGGALFGNEPARCMLAPMAVCTDGGDRVFVADGNGRRVHVFDLGARRYSVIEPGERFSMPVALAFDGAGGAQGAGRLLVSDSVESCLFVFDAEGRPTGRMGDGVFERPCGIAVAPDGRVFVADAGSHQVIVLSPDGRELRRLGERGSALGQFNYPTNLAFDHRGYLYVSDTMNFRVQVFTPSPELKAAYQIGSQGDLPGYFAQPKGVALDPDDHVYVVDANFEAVQLFDSDGALLMSLGREGQGPGEFWLPAGIHIDGRGRIFVADSYNQRVQVFQYLREGAQR